MLYPKIISAKVIDEALKLLDEIDKHYQKWVEDTRKKLAVGLAQLDKGEELRYKLLSINSNKK